MSEFHRDNANLSFEWDSENERLEIHGNSEALSDFAKALESLASGDRSDHIHLMTPDWGGNLANDQQNAAATLIHHVKVMVWK